MTTNLSIKEALQEGVQCLHSDCLPAPHPTLTHTLSCPQGHTRRLLGNPKRQDARTFPQSLVPTVGRETTSLPLCRYQLQLATGLPGSLAMCLSI